MRKGGNEPRVFYKPIVTVWTFVFYSAS